MAEKPDVLKKLTVTPADGSDSPGGLLDITPRGAEGADIKVTEKEGGGIKIDIQGLTFQQALEMELWLASTSPEVSKEARDEVTAIYLFIKNNIRNLKITLRDDLKGMSPSYEYNPETTTEEDIEKHLNSGIVYFLTAKMHGRGEEFLKLMDELTKQPGEEKLHKQPRGLLKSLAQIVGRDTSAPTLFSIPEDAELQTNTIKAVMSKKTAVLGNYLLQLWQKEKNLIGGKLRITNLAPIVRYLGTSHSELKIYLLYLGGYTYPMVTNDEDGGITLSQEQLFRIEFKYSRETAGKYKKEIGTTLLAFLRDAPVQYVDITPNIALLDGMKGKGLGNVLVSDNYIKLALDISDLAYKILSYTASNRPSQRIGEDKLIEKLNLQEQQKKRGTPWMRQQISKGFTELQEKRHIKKWNFDEAEQIYSFTYTNEIVKHQDFTPKGDPPKKPTKTPHKSRSQN